MKKFNALYYKTIVIISYVLRFFGALALTALILSLDTSDANISRKLLYVCAAIPVSYVIPVIVVYRHRVIHNLIYDLKKYLNRRGENNDAEFMPKE